MRRHLQQVHLEARLRRDPMPSPCVRVLQRRREQIKSVLSVEKSVTTLLYAIASKDSHCKTNAMLYASITCFFDALNRDMALRLATRFALSAR